MGNGEALADVYGVGNMAGHSMYHVVGQPGPKRHGLVNSIRYCLLRVCTKSKEKFNVPF